MIDSSRQENSSKSVKRIEGIVQEALPGTTFKILSHEGKEILGHLSGKMRIHYIKILPGDRVLMEVSPYDETKGRIVRRL